MIDRHSEFRFALLRDHYKDSNRWAGSSISSRISRYINLKLSFSIVFVCHIDVHIQLFSIYTKLSKTMAFEKFVFSIVEYGLLSHLRYLYRFYHSHAARTWSFCSEMYDNVFRYKYLTFQTQIYLHKQYIFDTNIIQSEYALLFPFSIDYVTKCIYRSNRIRWRFTINVLNKFSILYHVFYFAYKAVQAAIDIRFDRYVVFSCSRGPPNIANH